MTSECCYFNYDPPKFFYYLSLSCQQVLPRAPSPTPSFLKWALVPPLSESGYLTNSPSFLLCSSIPPFDALGSARPLTRVFLHQVIFAISTRTFSEEHPPQLVSRWGPPPPIDDPLSQRNVLVFFCKRNT